MRLPRLKQRCQKRTALPVATCAEETTQEKTSKRTGLFASGVVATWEGRRIALFFSGRQHAGENLADVLRQRADDLAPPVQMCDALSRNLPAELKTILANCLARARRRFADVAVSFRDECRHVLKSLKVVYHKDALARGNAPHACRKDTVGRESDFRTPVVLCGLRLRLGLRFERAHRTRCQLLPLIDPQGMVIVRACDTEAQ